jgi:tetratricopeptide (TPR) repeat protein
MDEAKIHFLFGDAPLGGLDPDVAADREKLLGAGTDMGQEERELRLTVATQIAIGTPPEVWAAAQRLLAQGLERDEAMEHLLFALRHAARTAALEETEIDGEAYAGSLAWLPLPDLEATAKALVDAVRAVPGAATAEAIRLAMADLKRVPEDILATEVVSGVGEQLVDGDGPLAWLSDDRLVHVGDLVAGSILTHRLSVEEQTKGFLDGAELVGFDRLEPLHLAGGGEVGVGSLDEDNEYLVFEGPAGWLAEFPAGALVGVRVSAEGELTIDAVEEPVADPDLVSRVRTVYEAQIEDAELPATLSEIALGLLIENPHTFAEACLPLGELCEAAGLEHRGNEVAHNPAYWANGERLRALGRVLRTFEGDTERTAVLRAMDGAREPGLTPAMLREILDGLEEPELVEFVADELITMMDSSTLDAAAFAERLLRAARRPPQVAVASWLAAVVAERQGNTLEAEEHVRRAVEATPTWEPAADRAGWYAFDRGEAAEAARIWGAMADPPDDLDVVEDFVAGPGSGSGGEPGRNDPCWCGSGRKYKACHLGRPQLPSLPERADWLYRKAVGFLVHQGARAEADLEYLGRRLASDPDDEEALVAAIEDPLLTDVLLVELGWFRRFLAQRSALLPDDEAVLAATWAEVARTVYEVTDIADTELTLRDRQTGKELEVARSSYAEVVSEGTLICGRAVFDGQDARFIGASFEVEPGTEQVLLELCRVGRADPILSFVAAARRPPTSPDNLASLLAQAP